MSKPFRGGRDAKRWMPELVGDDDEEDAPETRDWHDEWVMSKAPEQADVQTEMTK
jgi:hypothetical protein